MRVPDRDVTKRVIAIEWNPQGKRERQTPTHKPGDAQEWQSWREGGSLDKKQGTLLKIGSGGEH